MSLRVALIGNMNNGNFSLMRHLRDEGVDAHLLMYRDEAPHFYPQHDTWDWSRWSPFVRQLPISNGGLDSLLATRRSLSPAFDGYDAHVGNGIAPVLFRTMRRKLDLFLPYAEGVEFIIHHSSRWRHPASTAFSWARKRMMESALLGSVKATATANLHAHSQDTFRRLNIQPLNLPLIALYAETPPVDPPMPAGVASLIDRMRTSSLVVFSHVSQIWKNLPVPHFMGGVGKRNNWLVEGFTEYRHRSGDRDALLCLFEYGVDVPATKLLIASLGIGAQVAWFPKMSRREISCLLQHADIGGGEFAGMYWGGCGWEFLAAGVPMLHQLDDTHLYARPGQPLAPFFNVASPHDIARVLLENDRASLRESGVRARAWFDAHNGSSLAREYVALIGRLSRQ